MNRAELIATVAEKTGLTKKDVGTVVGAVIETVTATVASGDEVGLVGFGTFKQADRAARECKNPKTGEKIQVPAKVVPVFKAGKAFKDAVGA